MQNRLEASATNYKEYKKAEWFGAAINWHVDPHTVGTSQVKYDYLWKGDYLKSDWFQFQEAVKTHQAVAFNVLGETFRQMEIDVA